MLIFEHTSQLFINGQTLFSTLPQASHMEKWLRQFPMNQSSWSPWHGYAPLNNIHLLRTPSEFPPLLTDKIGMLCIVSTNTGIVFHLLLFGIFMLLLFLRILMHEYCNYILSTLYSLHSTSLITSSIPLNFMTTSSLISFMCLGMTAWDWISISINR